jgi:hypothetical protein
MGEPDEAAGTASQDLRARPEPDDAGAPTAHTRYEVPKPTAQSADEGIFDELDDEEDVPPPVLLGQGPYKRSDKHLWDELLRVDQLVRARTRTWRRTIGASKSDDLWGMILVSDAEVRAYLRQTYLPPDQLPGPHKDIAERYRARADALAQAIQIRVDQTPSDVALRLVELARLFDLSALHRDLLLVCLLPELDARYRRLFGYLQDDASRTRPTVELALQIVLHHEASPEAGRAAFAGTSAKSPSPCARCG